ncbi:MAG: serine/threonine protein kinase [Kiritimatiellae bacterium]|nr:serine/threonine protein kinase [Kiritimatiellia bacterium]
MSDEQLIATPGVFGENGNFLLERELGRGGMGGVYMGRDKMLDRPVAVKVMLKEYGNDAAFVEKFKREAQAAARLIHPNIAQVYSYGISDGMPYIAMELVAGGSLDGLMKVHGAEIDVPRVMKICEQVAQALRCAADQGLVHGDVKPENVLLDANGNAKLVDFGLAAMQKDTNEIWGTPYYIAPEKVKKEPVDYRADMYSLGGTIYHALTGVAPFEGDDATAVVRKRFEGAPKKPSEVRPGLSPQIDFLVMKMLAFNPADRYPSFEALLDDYKKVLTTGLSKTQTVAAAASAGAAAGLGGDRKTTSASGKKLTIKGKKKFTVHKPSADESQEPEGGAEGETGRHPTLPSRFSNGEEGGYEDEEGGVGGKVTLVIGGVILAIVAVAGGLYWMISANKRDAEEKAAARIEKGFNDLQANYPTLEQNVNQFTEDVEKTCKGIEDKCQKTTDSIANEMKKIYPASYIAKLKPPKPVKAKPAPAPAAEGAKGGAKADAPAAPAQAETSVQEPERFPPPQGDEADPQSPEYEDYQRRKKEWEDKRKAAEAAASGAANAAVADAAGGEGATAAEEVLEEPSCVETMSKLWKQAYKCLDGRDKILDELAALQEEIEKASGTAPAEKTEAALDTLKKQQDDFKNRLETIKAMTEWEEIEEFSKKTMPRACAKADSECKATVKAIVKKREEEENKKKIEEANRRREEEEAAKRAERLERETTEIKERYDAVVQSYVLNLEWELALSELERTKSGFQSGEARVLADQYIDNVKSIQLMQTVISRNLVGWEFKRKEKEKDKPSLVGYTVAELDGRFIICKDKKGRAKKITWRMLYTDYHGNLSTLINKFVIGGDKNGTPKLRSSEWSRAMFGAALTLQFLCSDDPTAAPFIETLVKKTVKENSAYKDVAERLFPDIDLSEVEAEAEASEL